MVLCDGWEPKGVSQDCIYLWLSIFLRMHASYRLGFVHDVFLASPRPLTLLLKIKKTSVLLKWLKREGGDRFIPHKKIIKAYLSQQKEQQRQLLADLVNYRRKRGGHEEARYCFSAQQHKHVCVHWALPYSSGGERRGHTVQTRAPQSLLLSVSGFPGSTQVEECSSGSCCVVSGLINRLRPCWIHTLSFKSPTVETDVVMVQRFTAIFHLVCEFLHSPPPGTETFRKCSRPIAVAVFVFPGVCHKRISFKDTWA